MTRVRRPLLALIGLLAALGVGYGAQAVDEDESRTAPSSSVASPVASSSSTTSSPTSSRAATAAGVPLSDLPREAADTVRRIEAGGPFPYPAKDGDTFRNLERRLPSAPTGFYREYTVPTPGEDDRGARRIVTGRDGRYWYTADHYDSFVLLDTGR